MKTTDKLGWTLALCSALFMGWFITTEYRTSAIHEPKFSAEYEARLDDIRAGITPIFTADLGE